MNKSGILDVRSYYQMFEASDELANGLSLRCKAWSKRLRADIEDIPEFPGVNVWVNCTGNNNIVYVGEALSDKTGLLRRRIKDEVYEERLFFYLRKYDVEQALALFRKYYPGPSEKDSAKIRLVARHFERSARKKGTTHIVWHANNELPIEDLRNIKGELMSRLHPAANQQTVEFEKSDSTANIVRSIVEMVRALPNQAL